MREQLDAALAGGVDAQVVVQPHGLEQLVADRVDGAERGPRLLEHQTDVAAANTTHLLAVWLQRHEVTPVVALPEEDLAALDLPRLLHDPQDRAGHDALTAAGLAHDADDAAGRNVERDPVDGLHQTLRRVVVRREVADRQQDVGCRASRTPRSRVRSRVLVRHTQSP